MKSEKGQRGKQDTGPRERPPKPVTASWLEASGLYYLGRFAASEKRFQEVMTRKIKKRTHSSGPLSEEESALLQDLTEKCQRLGYLDDARYARMRRDTLHARGKPQRTIQRELQVHGIDREIILEVLAELHADGDPDTMALVKYAKRRRFGPFALQSGRPKAAEKQIAAIVRAGFSFDQARLVVSAEDEAALLQQLGEV